MRYLVDTQIFLWFLSERDRFSVKAREFLEDVHSNRFFLSDASAWEVAIKYGLRKLKLPERPELFFVDRVRQADYQHLRIALRHVTRVHTLPLVHRDPFDRLLITQAISEGMTIISEDRIFKSYEVGLLTLKDIS